MRDPNRIDKFCLDLAKIWHEVPDWRFGQLMINIMSHYITEYGRDAFYVEDDNFMKWMQAQFKTE